MSHAKYVNILKGAFINVPSVPFIKVGNDIKSDIKSDIKYDIKRQPPLCASGARVRDRQTKAERKLSIQYLFNLPCLLNNNINATIETILPRYGSF